MRQDARRGAEVVNKVLDAAEQTDELLIAEAAREGSDGPAFAALVGRHRERVWRICYRLLGNEHDAQDAAQEVFVRLFLHRAKFAGRSRFSTWLHGIAVRTCLTLRRGRSRRRRREGIADAETLEHHAGAAPTPRQETGLDTMALLDVLDEEDRAMLILKYAEGYSYEDLAEMFDLGVSACKMRLSRAREKLQRHAPKDD
jgi:RNA polymerase sigma-70 factor, ECF subfamily